MPPQRMPVVYGIDVGYQFTKIAVSYPRRHPSGEGFSYPEANFCHLPDTQTAMIPTTVKYQNDHAVIGVEPSPSVSGDSASGKDNRSNSNATFENGSKLKLEGLHRWFKLRALCSANGGEETGRARFSRPYLEPADPALRVLEDYLNGLRQVIRRLHDQAAATKDGISFWHQADIDFIFSVPSIVGESGARILEETARLAGFASSNKRHNVPFIELTEAEAAGVHAATSMKEIMSMGDTALVIDVGGGTSDLSMLTLTGNEQWKLDTNFLQPVSSDRLGGAQIDKVIGEKMASCLGAVAETGTDLTTTCRQVGSIQSREKYHEAKFLCKEMDIELNFPVTSHALERQLLDGLEGKEVHLTGPDLHIVVQARLFARLLDTQIHGTASSPGIVSLAVTMRDDLAVRSPSQSRQHDRINELPRHCKGDVTKPDTLDFVFFAGGLGPAPRLRDAVKGALAAKPDEVRLRHTTANTRYRPVQDAQHAVALGLVEYWTGKLASTGQDDGFVFKTWLKRLASE